MRVGFIGLGKMGRGMASNIARSEHDLMVYDQDPSAVAALQEAGAAAAGSVAELAAGCEVVFTSLPGPVQLEEVVYGDGGILATMLPGLTLFDLSTSSLALARRIHQSFEERGGTMLDSPISGGPAGAASGDLALWIGGDEQAFATHRDLLLTFSNQPQHVGPIGAGTVTKLAHNMLGFMIMECLSEVISVGVKAGLDPLNLWEAMRTGLVGRRSPMDMLVNQFLPGDYDHPAMALKLAHKDATLATAMGRELGVPMRLADLTLAEMTEAVGRGFAERDRASFLQLQLERAGVTVQVDAERLAAAVERAAQPRP